MKSTILWILLLLVSTSVFTQSSKYDIKGSVFDTLNNPLIYSMVLLLEKGDSTMVDFTQSELDGSFKFKDAEVASEYLVKSTYLGYIPLTVDATSPDGKNLNLGKLEMTELAKELMEVVIKAARAAIKMRGDTVEYDATTFKVPEGSTVEDLLRRLPGLEVESDGSILADGKNVNKVTVDGKSFFGSDPKAATKNLPAEGVSKVQVFDTKTEEEEITGSTGQSQDKTMNLELKEEFKTGGFGRVVAGIGNEDRRELKGNYNRFNDKIQFSLVGVGNNTGRNGLSWDDYQDFLGSNSFNFDDSSDYGFGSGGGHYIVFGGGGTSLESSIQSLFFSGSSYSGLPENYNAGVNFNYDDKKTKLSSVYYYNQAGLVKNTTLSRDRFFDTFTQNEQRIDDSDDISRGHRVEMKVEHEIDSLHTLKLNFNGAYIDQDKLNYGNINLSEEKKLRSQSEFENRTNTSGYLANGLILLNKKFMKKGRRLGMNASILTTELDDNWTQNSTTDFFDNIGVKEKIDIINQINQNAANKNLFKANALFVEPLSGKFFFHTFYNYSNRAETGDRDVKDYLGAEQVINTALSRTYENSIRLNRIGSSVRYSHNGINISTGLAYQSFSLAGDYTDKQIDPITGVVDKEFANWLPNVSINVTPVRNAYISFSFSRHALEPDIQNLQAVVNNTNPLFIRVGNPDLVPQVSNVISMYVSRSYPASGVRFNVNLRYSIFDHQFSSEEFVDENLITTYKTINIDGGNTGSVWTGFNFPIIKNKITVRTNLSVRLSTTPTYVNSILNNTIAKAIYPSLRINFTPSKDVALYLNGRIGISKTEYDLNSSQDQLVKNQSLGVEFNSKLLFGLFLNSNLDYNRYTNDRFDLTQEIPILNASIYKQFLTGKKGEIRLSIYDGFNKNVGFSQGTSNNSISQSRSNALGRYYMLSFTYNIRGLKTGVKKDGWW